MPSTTLQDSLCGKYGVKPNIPAEADKLGIALGTPEAKPLNGLRHLAQSGTCGWYIWGGDAMPTDDEAFAPLHVSHLSEYCPEAIQFLGLPPGWRFLMDGEFTDVWEDQELLNV